MVRLFLLIAAFVIGLVAVLFMVVEGEEEAILMVHTSAAGSAASNGDGSFTLQVSDVSEVIWFTDHPDREAGTMALDAYLLLLQSHGLEEEPLNATLEANGFLYPLELLDVAGGGSTGGLSYTVAPLDESVVKGPTALGELGAFDFDAATLFIDGEPTTVNGQITD